ncbi:MAG: SDR family oxidoreductase [Candidatus Sericytochromatia bacterium]
MTKVALVTGSNKGIGFEVVRQFAKKGYTVILTSRDEKKGQEAVTKLKNENLLVDYCVLEVSNSDSVTKAKNYIEEKYGKLDILVNNAGLLLDKNENVFTISEDLIKETMETNFYGALKVTQAFIPLMKKNNYGRIVNVSSGMGQLSDMGGGYTAYRVSKTALNALTKIMANDLRGSNILINTMCPGWVKTDMGGASATRTTEKGAETIVWLSELEENSYSGAFFRDKKEIEW